ncbi:hypothetical protein GKZ92_22930 (plasmid) [Gordonia sp. 135]|nr:hypothetical protein GKZ92_22930 [Gordonia sp. 135]
MSSSILPAQTLGQQSRTTTGPLRRAHLITLDDLTLIVRPPGRPADIQTFTDDEIAAATAYATANNAEVEQLP